MLKNTNFTNAGEYFAQMVEKNFNIANTMLESYKQATIIQCNAANKFIEESNSLVKQLSHVTSPAEALANVKTFASNVLINNINSRKELAQVFAGNKLLFGNLSSASVKSFQDSLLKSTEGFASVNPEFAKAASDALNTMISKSNQVVDTVTKMTENFTETANQQLSAATAKVIEKATEVASQVQA